MRKNQTNDVNEKIKSNFRLSGLTEEQYVNACKQYLYAIKNYKSFGLLPISEQVNYLLNKNILDMRFLGDIGLVEILKTYKDLTLTDIYSSILSMKVAGSNLNIDVLPLLSDKDENLVVNPELFLNKISKMCQYKKRITFWTTNSFIKDLLIFDYGENQNIAVKINDIYNNDINDETKYQNILCIPPFGLKRHFKNNKYCGNDSSTIAMEILFNNNLSDNGLLSMIMPVKVNFSQTESVFRQKYIYNLREVVNLPADTFSNTKVKTYLDKFDKNKSDNLIISDSIGTIGDKHNISEIINIDLTWDFEKPFKEEDEDVSCVLNQKHKKLKDISNIFRGKPLSKYAREVEHNEDFTYIDMKAIKQDYIDYQETKKYVIDKDLSLEYLQNGDIIVPNKGNTSKVVLYKNSDTHCIASSNILVIRTNKAIVEPEYLLLYLRSAIGQKLVKNIQRGTAMPFINHEDLKGIAVVVPSLEKQHNLLKEYNTKMDKYKTVLNEVTQNITRLEQEVNDIICGRLQDFQ